MTAKEKNNRGILNIYQLLSEVYEALNDHEKALQYYKLHSRSLKKIHELYMSAFAKQWENFTSIEARLRIEVPITQQTQLPNLTFTELKITAMLREGLSSKEIAERLHISKRTVDQHRFHIRKKCNLENGKDLRTYFAEKLI